MSLLTAGFVINSHTKTRIYFIFPKKRLKTNLKGFCHQIPTSMKRSEKQSPNKGNSREIREIIAVMVG